MAEPVGLFTDTSICIGCKACEVACKEWNQLPGNEPQFRDSFDNTGQLDAQNWRHVKFIERMPEENMTVGNGQAWLMMSDICKHCTHASCLEVCPTHAIVRTEFDSVFIQQEACNGCRACIGACPYGAIGFNEDTGTVHKCTMCYDRLQNNMTPACAKVCPTQSIQFGKLADLKDKADARLATLQRQGNSKAQLYGRDDKIYGGLGAFFLLMDKPEVYGLPDKQNAVLPRRNNAGGYLGALLTAAVALFAGAIALRRNGSPAPEETQTVDRSTDG
ncbi:MAG: 4Fe-4S ferredoxin [Candidatus Eremiobacter antarcticus]|nr:4Fe-4S dicluster domain-containing protein [Candidatus Eremiobacteraeota bacterium]MBC5809045.1 4Fe-4S dicluster domain-containing protein [Candidatus Eremiobacteraeota bacterium]PZR64278.1 MAG: 4Fe-4S ferredoxin [Candidatus Eremiobacter sp. RRmetagenome_bin22]